MQLNFIKVISICLIFFIAPSCNSNEPDLKTNNSDEKIDINEICECINGAEYKNTKAGLQIIANCIKKHTSNDIEEYNRTIAEAMHNCPDFIEKNNRLMEKESGFDTLEFVPMTNEFKKKLYIGKWFVYGMDEKNYSITSGDTVFQYQNNEINEIWLKIDTIGMTEIFIVLDDDKYAFLPSINDTFKYTLIGFTDTVIKGEMRVRGLKLNTYTYK